MVVLQLYMFTNWTLHPHFPTPLNPHENPMKSHEHQVFQHHEIPWKSHEITWTSSFPTPWNPMKIPLNPHKNPYKIPWRSHQIPIKIHNKILNKIPMKHGPSPYLHRHPTACEISAAVLDSTVITVALPPQPCAKPLATFSSSLGHGSNAGKTLGKPEENAGFHGISWWTLWNMLGEMENNS